jgi:ankyrin repeat protein/tetratricopeptide (TPR) repeat protein
LNDLFHTRQNPRQESLERGISRSFSFDNPEAIANGLCRAVQLADIDFIQALLLRRIPSESIFTPCLSLQGLRHMTALHYAVETSSRTSREILKMLLRYAPSDTKDQIDVLGQGEVERKHYGLQRRYRTGLDFEDYTVLCWACLHANVEAVQLLLNSRASPNSSTSYQSTTPLIAICSRSSTSEQDEEAKIIMLLLRAGAKLDVQDSKGNAPLHYLLQRPPFKLARLLLSRASSSNTKITSRNIHGWTLLHCVAFHCNGEDAHELIRTIMDNGVRIHVKNRHGLTAFELAEKYGNEHVVTILRPYEEYHRRKIAKQISTPIVPTISTQQENVTSSPPIASPGVPRAETAPQPNEGPFRPPGGPPKLPARPPRDTLEEQEKQDTESSLGYTHSKDDSSEQLEKAGREFVSHPKEPLDEVHARPLKDKVVNVPESPRHTPIPYPERLNVPINPTDQQVEVNVPLDPAPIVENQNPIQRVPTPEVPNGPEKYRSTAEWLLINGNFGNAEVYYRLAFPESTRLQQPSHFQSLTTVWKLAIEACVSGAWAESASLYRGLLGLCESQAGSEGPMTVDIVGNLALVYLNAEMWKEADPLTLRALRGKERVYGPLHENTLDMILAMGNAKVGQGDLVSAATYYNRILDSPIPQNHRLRLRARNGWGDIYTLQGKYSQAEAMYTEVVGAMKAGLLQGNLIEQIDICRDFGNLYKLMENWPMAEQYYRDLLKARTEAYGPNHPEVVQTIEDLMAIIEKQRRPSDCWIQETLPGVAQTTRTAIGGNTNPTADVSVPLEQLTSPPMGPSDPTLAQVQLRLGYARREHDQRHYETAEQLYAELLAMYERLTGPESQETLQVLEERGVNLCRVNRYRMLEARSAKLTDFVDATSTGLNLVEAQQRCQASIAMFERVIAGREKMPNVGKNHPETIRAVFALGAAIISAGESARFSAAERLFERGLRFYQTFYSEEHPDTLRWMLYVVERYCSMAHKTTSNYRIRILTNAEALAQRVIKIRDRLYGYNAKETVEAIEVLIDVYRAQGQELKAREFEKRLPANSKRMVRSAFGGLAKSLVRLDSKMGIGEGSY